MPYQPHKVHKMELEVPAKARKAFRSAYRNALNSGLKVLIVEGGKLVEVSPDFSKREIRSVAHAKKVLKGTTFHIPRS